MTDRSHSSGPIDAAMATVLALALSSAASLAPILGAAPARAEAGVAGGVGAGIRRHLCRLVWLPAQRCAAARQQAGNRPQRLCRPQPASTGKPAPAPRWHSCRSDRSPVSIISASATCCFPTVFPTASRGATAAIQEPTIVLAGYEGQPEISGMACAKRASAEHNLAFRCNAPVAMNVPGGKASSSRFLTEMEAETGLRLGRDFWAGDPDAGTGARLLTARDVVTGMRFTLRYIDERGFTRAANSCADQGRWRWSYVCITDARWAAKSMVEQCHFVVDEMLSVEGGPVARWTFAPCPPRARPRARPSPSALRSTRWPSPTRPCCAAKSPRRNRFQPPSTAFRQRPKPTDLRSLCCR